MHFTHRIIVPALQTFFRVISIYTEQLLLLLVLDCSTLIKNNKISLLLLVQYFPVNSSFSSLNVSYVCLSDTQTFKCKTSVSDMFLTFSSRKQLQYFNCLSPPLVHVIIFLTLLNTLSLQHPAHHPSRNEKQHKD